MLSDADGETAPFSDEEMDDRGGKPVGTSFRAVRISGANSRSSVRGSVMMAKPFVMMVVATLIGPAVGVGLFILMNNF